MSKNNVIDLDREKGLREIHKRIDQEAIEDDVEEVKASLENLQRDIYDYLFQYEAWTDYHLEDLEHCVQGVLIAFRTVEFALKEKLEAGWDKDYDNEGIE